jgi:hypothetical protein
MGQGTGLMKPVPPRLAEALVGFLIPPACREHVLGDLHERYTSPIQYFIDVLATVPLVILSRIRRTTDPVVLLMEAFVLYVSFLAAAAYFERALLNDQMGLFRLALPAAIAIVALVLSDAYDNPRRKSPLKPMLGSAFSVACAFLSQAVLSAGHSSLALSGWIVVCGGGVSILLVSTLRILFPPVADQRAGVNMPASWQKQAVEPITLDAVKVSSQEALRKAQEFQARIQRRNLIEYALVTLLLVAVGVYVWYAPIRKPSGLLFAAILYFAYKVRK